MDQETCIDDNLKRFNEGNTVYFVASSIFVRKAEVVRNTGGFCTIVFDGNGNFGTSGTRIHKSKLYRTEEEANAIVKQHKEASEDDESSLYFGLANTTPPYIDLN